MSGKQEVSVETTDEWTDKFPELRDDIDIHIDQLVDMSDLDKYQLRRMIFISIKQHLEDRL